jgi:excinuclease UvrABC ATPase subunit
VESAEIPAVVHGVEEAGGELGVPLDVPWRELPEQARETVLRGKGGFVGVYGFFAQMEKKKYKLHVRVMLSKYRGYAECPDCRGSGCGLKHDRFVSTGRIFARRRR